MMVSGQLHAHAAISSV